MTFDEGLVFRLDCGLKPGYYSGGEGESVCKDKISTQINLWYIVAISCNIFLAQCSHQFVKTKLEK